MRHLTNTLVKFLKSEDGSAPATSGGPAGVSSVTTAIRGLADIQSGRAPRRTSSDPFEQSLRGNGRNRRRAAATAELAILLPLLAFLFVIAVDYARVFYFSLTVENCARNGALYGSDPFAPTQSSYTSITQAALADAANLQPQPTVTSANGTDTAGNAYVEVTVAWQFASLTNFPGVPSTTNLSRTVRMRVAPTTPK